MKRGHDDEFWIMWRDIQVEYRWKAADMARGWTNDQPREGSWEVLDTLFSGGSPFPPETVLQGVV